MRFADDASQNKPALWFAGVSRSRAEDKKHFTTAVYGNGPGYQIANGVRPDVNESISCKSEHLNALEKTKQSSSSLLWYKSVNPESFILRVFILFANFGQANLMRLSRSSSAGNDYLQQAPVPLDSETHGIEDVAIFAKGPMSHLYHGVQEQSYIAHVMAFAACLEPYEGCHLPSPSHAGVIHPSLLLLLMGLVFLFL